ncbi:MAG: 2-hydroxyacid dehydrogenase [Alphaproteobacteria bacterium]|nr:2-hydroxyacid dehydrogenase [Alphaproteobacteria bacterium]
MKIVYFDSTRDFDSLNKAFPGLMDGVDVYHDGKVFGDDDLIARLEGAQVAVNGHSPMSNAALETLAPTLKRIVFLGTGAATYIDIDHANSLGISVQVVRDYGSRSIAEFAFGLALDACRQISVMDRGIRQGQWRVLGGPELRGKTMGVVGLGGIGKEMVRISAGFGMKVIAWNRSPMANDLPCQQVSLEDLFSQSDVVSLHVASTAQTQNMINADLLARMKPGAVLVNVARGEIIDTAALIDALKNGPLGHAALDVFTQEPLPADNPLCSLDNVTLTAHAAWNTPDADRTLMEIGFGLARADF